MRAPVRPATRWRRVVSSASARVIAGRMVVSRRASTDFPAPGVPWSSGVGTDRLHQFSVYHRGRTSGSYHGLDCLPGVVLDSRPLVVSLCRGQRIIPERAWYSFSISGIVRKLCRRRSSSGLAVVGWQRVMSSPSSTCASSMSMESPWLIAWNTWLSDTPNRTVNRSSSESVLTPSMPSA
jgi:hypothetical protein